MKVNTLALSDLSDHFSLLSRLFSNTYKQIEGPSAKVGIEDERRENFFHKTNNPKLFFLSPLWMFLRSKV